MRTSCFLDLRVSGEPLPSRALTSAAAGLETAYGRAAVRWAREGDAFTLEVTVPPSTEADVFPPDGAAYRAASGTHRYTCILPGEQVLERPATFAG